MDTPERMQSQFPRNALDAYELGLSVIRLQEPIIGDPTSGKRPVEHWKRFTQQRCGRAQAARMQQYGIVTGAINNCVVIDVDAKERLGDILKLIPETPRMTETPRGVHLWYAHPGQLVRNGIKLRNLPVDVRADGAYVVGPGANHGNGGQYQARGDWSLDAKLPTFDPSWLEGEREYSESKILVDAQEDRVRVIRRAMAYVEKMPPAVSGKNGHVAYLRVVSKLLDGFRLSISEALPIILSFNARCEPPFSDNETRHKIQSVLQRERSHAKSPTTGSVSSVPRAVS